MYVNAALFIEHKTGCSFCPCHQMFNLKLSSDWSAKIFTNILYVHIQIGVKFWTKWCRETNWNSPAKISYHREVILLCSFLLPLIISQAPDFHHLFSVPFSSRFTSHWGQMSDSFTWPRYKVRHCKFQKSITLLNASVS